MNTQDFSGLLEELVAAGKLTQVLSILVKLLKPYDRELYRQVVLLSARLEEARKRQRETGEYGNEWHIAHNRVARDLLDLLGLMDQYLGKKLPDEMISDMRHICYAAGIYSGLLAEPEVEVMHLEEEEDDDMIGVA